MEDSTKLEELQPEGLDSAIEVGITFLRALFADEDKILLRPIETWTERGKKYSRVDFRKTYYRVIDPKGLLKPSLVHLYGLAAQERLNLFFGVCPRLDGQGRFDLASGG